MISEAKEAHEAAISERELCRMFSVSRSWYYERPSLEEKATRDIELRDAIERIVLEFPGYGYRRVTKELCRRGWTVNHKRVLRVMRQESLLCQIKRRFVVTTDAAHAFGVYPNLLKDTKLDGLDQVWISDITYVRLPTSFCYLAAILDAYSRRCVGWHLSPFIDTRLTLSAALRRPPHLSLRSGCRQCWHWAVGFSPSGHAPYGAVPHAAALKYRRYARGGNSDRQSSTVGSHAGASARCSRHARRRRRHRGSRARGGPAGVQGLSGRGDEARLRPTRRRRDRSGMLFSSCPAHPTGPSPRDPFSDGF